MRYSLEPKYRKYVKGYGFLLFARECGEEYGRKYGKKLMDTATKTGIDSAETTCKRVVQKPPEAAIDLTGDKIADKLLQQVKTKSKKQMK